MSRASRLNDTRSSSSSRVRNGTNYNSNNNANIYSSSSIRPATSTTPHRTTSRTQIVGQNHSMTTENKQSPSITAHTVRNENMVRPYEEFYGHQDDRHRLRHSHQSNTGVSIDDDRRSVSSRGSEGSRNSYRSISPQATHSPPSPSKSTYSRYDEQLRNSLNSLGIEGYSDAPNHAQLQHQVQVSSNRRRSGDYPVLFQGVGGSPVRPRSAPSSVSASPLSTRPSRLNIGEQGVESDGGGKDIRGGIAMARNGSQRSAAIRSISASRLNSSRGRIDRIEDHAAESLPPAPPHRVSGRPPIPVPTHAYSPPSPPYNVNMRAAPYSTLKDTGGRPPPLLSTSLIPSYSRM